METNYSTIKWSSSLPLCQCFGDISSTCLCRRIWPTVGGRKSNQTSSLTRYNRKMLKQICRTPSTSRRFDSIVAQELDTSAVTRSLKSLKVDLIGRRKKERSHEASVSGIVQPIYGNPPVGARGHKFRIARRWTELFIGETRSLRALPFHLDLVLPLKIKRINHAIYWYHERSNANWIETNRIKNYKIKKIDWNGLPLSLLSFLNFTNYWRREIRSNVEMKRKARKYTHKMFLHIKLYYFKVSHTH